ncbi:trypsin-like peptidase domain-containing protein [Candidatus Saccharibacteria bacterium]|nr:trypsin-like peptidase domain-containing protein [Candidatus Saccharibacteria bacterium]
MKEPIIKDAKIIETSKTTEATEKPKASGNGLKIAAFVIALFALFFSIGSSVLSAFTLLALGSSSPSTVGFANEFNGLDSNSANFTEGSIAEVANSVSNSVVSILTEVKSTQYNLFYGPTESTGSAAGTGIIVSSDGYVLTNKHVIDGATKIYVVLDNGTVYNDVSLVATDPLNDVAFLKINNAENLSAAKLGDSKTITTGQQVIAIGNALGQYQNTVTSGIISGTGRSLVATDSNYQSAETLTDMIQTDAAINSGNSGGPLVNAAGEVIGINTAVSSGNNIGFAIPISSVKGMLNSLLKTGEAKRAYAGISYSSINASNAIENKLPTTTGAYVNSVVSGSPADSAGLKQGDIIIAVDGIKIAANSSLGTLLGEHSVGDKATLTIIRGNNQQETTLTLTEYKS